MHGRKRALKRNIVRPLNPEGVNVWLRNFWGKCVGTRGKSDTKHMNLRITPGSGWTLESMVLSFVLFRAVQCTVTSLKRHKEHLAFWNVGHMKSPTSRQYVPSFTHVGHFPDFVWMFIRMQSPVKINHAFETYSSSSVFFLIKREPKHVDLSNSAHITVDRMCMWVLFLVLLLRFPLDCI